MTVETELDIVAPLFLEPFNAMVAEAEAQAPNYPREQWDRSGRVSKDAPNKRDHDWWLTNGPLMVAEYAQWRADTRWDLAVFDGEPAVEVKLEFQLNDTTVLGYIDRVFRLADGSLCVVDLKTGSMVPSSTMQLGVYATGIEVLYGERPQWGCFWMPGKGATALESLDKWTYDVLASIYQDVEGQIVDARFPPKQSFMCNGCSVRDYCHVYGGEFASEFDPLISLPTHNNEEK